MSQSRNLDAWSCTKQESMLSPNRRTLKMCCCTYTNDHNFSWILIPRQVSTTVTKYWLAIYFSLTCFRPAVRFCTFSLKQYHASCTIVPFVIPQEQSQINTNVMVQACHDTAQVSVFNNCSYLPAKNYPTFAKTFLHSTGQ